LKKAYMWLLPVLAAVLAVGASLLSPGAAHAAVKPSLPVTFAHDGSAGSAGFDAAGNIALNLGNGTYAEMDVTLGSAVSDAEPAAPPSFVTSAYAAGSPRWVVELSDGYYLFGFPSQLGAGATDDFTGPQWSVQGPAATACGAGYVTYAKGLSCADPAGSGHVTHAFIVEDADQAANTADTLTGVQYDGLVPVPPAQPGVPYVYAGHVVSVSAHTAVVGWSDSDKGWPDDNHCVETYVYGFDTPPGVPHVGFTCDHGDRSKDLGYLRNLAAGHSVSMFIRPATGTYGSHHPIPGTNAQAHVYVVTPKS
jgi:hypothetical protein